MSVEKKTVDRIFFILAGLLINHVLSLLFILLVLVLIIFTLICVYFDKLNVRYEILE